MDITLDPNKGTKGSIFLNQEESARPKAMGDSFVAIAYDINSVTSNPAGLGKPRHLQVTSSYDNQFNNGANSGCLGAIYDRFGLNIKYVNVGEIEKVNSNDEFEGTTSANDLMIIGAYGYELSPGFSIGGAAKFVMESLDGKNAFGGGADIGILYQYKDSPIGILSFGAVAQNIGYESGMIKEGSWLPVSLKIGAAWESKLPKDHKLIVAAAVSGSDYSGINISLGVEYTFYNMISARVGTNTAKPLLGITSGIGFKLADLDGFRLGTLETKAGSLELDYAISLHPDLGLTHQVSLTYKR